MILAKLILPLLLLGSIHVGGLTVFGPAPVSLSDTRGRQARVVAWVNNDSSHSRVVNVKLTARGIPRGCITNLPLHESVSIPAHEGAWVELVPRFECHSPARVGSYPITLRLCAGMSCMDTTRFLLLED